MTEHFDASLILGELKDFQRRTVDHAFARMFDEAAPARRFLVADEVGLGKTMVAKGLIARTIERIQGKRGVDERIDIIYVCSNEAIAAQNVDRLTLAGQSSSARATRLTLLPLVTKTLENSRVNFISFTPGTTFNAGSSEGRKEERRLVYQMLRAMPNLGVRGLRNALQGGVENNWQEFVEHPLDFDETIADAFRNNVCTDVVLWKEVTEVAALYHDRRRSHSDEEQKRCRSLTGRLRAELARTCLGSLKPALVILDEFQRFGELFEEPDRNPSAELAHQLFNYSPDVRVLLLSATPYKMYVTDDDNEDHFEEFLKTVTFLSSGDVDTVSTLKANLAEFRVGLFGLQDVGTTDVLKALKSSIESLLSRVMCRTERVGLTINADSMIREYNMEPRLEPVDLHEIRWLESIAKALGQGDMMEYWKSSPYLFNFMRDYSHKHAFKTDLASRRPTLAALVELNQRGLLSPKAIEGYRSLDAGNPRVRTLIDEVRSQGLWRLLWMPPSLSYWKPAGVYQSVGSVTKHLIFSSWNVVPDALAGLLSYEVERQIVLQSGLTPGYAKMPKKFAARLLFSQSHERLSGMNTLMLMFPSRALVACVDPLEALSDVSGPMAFAQVKQRTAALLTPLLEPLLDRSVTTGAPDRRWYWVALARLEKSMYASSRAWCEKAWAEARRGTDQEDHDSDSVFDKHIRQWIDAWDGNVDDLGAVPEDVADILALLALAGPATCALRTLGRHWPLVTVSPSGNSVDSADHCFALGAAVRIAEGIRSQFNSPRAVGLLYALDEDDAYWHRVLQYSAEGNLQAVLDEYVHVLVESKSLRSKSTMDATQALATSIFEAMSLRTATLHPDHIGVVDGKLSVQSFSTGIRTHFALRYGAKTDDEKSVSRKEVVQAAFNSPFWPFVLASTSVGQEGLDFHTWCHSVIHWNLPSNPVDMEQREGRVHRYKGYAVRKNVASRYGVEMATSARFADGRKQDPWKQLFKLAVEGRPANANDLIPYWIFELDGGASIERRVMLLPVSRDSLKYQKLRRSLAMYRLVFAQPRQQDLMACLDVEVSDAAADKSAALRWRINLSPLLLGSLDA